MTRQNELYIGKRKVETIIPIRYKNGSKTIRACIPINSKLPYPIIDLLSGDDPKTVHRVEIYDDKGNYYRFKGYLYFDGLCDVNNTNGPYCYIDIELRDPIKPRRPRRQP